MKSDSILCSILGFMGYDCPPSENLLTLCNYDTDCNIDTEYCSKGKCRQHGRCRSKLDCFNPSNKYQQVLCLGSKYCSDEGYCGIDCSTGICPRATAQQYNTSICLGTPCEVNECNEPYATCVNHYCGGCHSIFFDPSGARVCRGDSIDDEDEEDEEQDSIKIDITSNTQCFNSSDCLDSEYCSDGLCRMDGSCQDEADCHHPENMFASVRCMGMLQCQRGKCRRNCGGCQWPCNRELCSDMNVATCRVQEGLDDSFFHVNDTKCVFDYCSCESYLFGPMGVKQVC